ncbi:MAG: MoxR family ATPase [Planctomycetes bacterium]|nr:MoxR family ATPase [Planctomycetota bacterium]
MTQTQVKYWHSIFRNYVLKGKPIPPRLNDALFNRLRIEVIKSPSDSSNLYSPHRTPDDINFINQQFSNYPNMKKEISSFAEPIKITSKPHPDTSMHSIDDVKIAVKFRMPSYGKTIANLIDFGRAILLVGPNGCGKTKLICELAKSRNKKVRRVNFDGGMTPESFLGTTKIRTQILDGKSFTETYFQSGPVTQAVKNGDWLILDELDKAQPEYVAALHAITEDIRNPLNLNEDGGHQIIPHPDFRIIATANTLGDVEDSALAYYGSNPMNQAFKDRFAIIRVNYPDNEPEILNDILHCPDLAHKMVQVAKLSRQAASNGEITGFDFSTRRLIN